MRPSDFKKNLPLLALVVIEVILFILNYQPGTFLVGWDNLYPELNFSANLKRNLFSVWQEYRGLGLPDGMAYTANLPHTLFIWFLSMFLPLSVLRYFFIFLMHFIGGVGIYFLLSRFVQKSSALLATIFYLINLTTIQMFYAPLEAFAVHFAFLPWLLFSLNSSWWYFLIFSILALPQSFIPQLFLVYLLFVFCVLAVHLKKYGKGASQKIITVCLIIFSVNSFWLLPFLYTASTNSQTIINSKINQMSSAEIYQKNKLRGSIFDVILLKGFMLDVVEFNKDSLTYIMSPYRKHINKLPFNIIAWLFFCLTLVGFVYSIKKKNHLEFVFPFFISFFFLGNDIWGLSWINNFLRDHIPILKEAFRFTFTKFSIAFMFCYTIFFALGIQLVTNFLKKFNRVWMYLVSIGIFSTIIFYSLPVFRGNFLFSEVRKEIPQQYFDTINFFSKQDKNSRIAMFPLPSFWSWRYHTNGYRGSGFLWYGIEQAQLDRAFDPWSKHNENFYWEASYAISSQDKDLLEKILNKYKINWIIMDKNLIYPQSPQAVFMEETILNSLAKAKQVSSFGNIFIYKIETDPDYKNFTLQVSDLPQIEPVYTWNNLDTAYINYQDYISSPNPEVYFPFRSLFNNHINTKDYLLKETENSFVFQKDIPDRIVNLPLKSKDEKIIWFDDKNLARRGEYLPKVNFDGKTLTVEIPKVKGYFSKQIDPTQIKEVKNCNWVKIALGEKEGEITNEIIDGRLRLKSKMANNCSASLNLGNFSHHLAYIITIEAKNILNNSLVFWIENISLKKPDVEINLPKTDQLSTHYFIQPPLDPYGIGYTLHFENKSFDRNYTINDLGTISIYSIPYTFLTNLTFTKLEPSQVKWSSVQTSHPLPFLYFVKSAKDNLILYQAYDPGWYAFGASKHFLVNNWANGWKVTADGTVIIIFLPQLLQFLGFGIFGLTLYYLYKLKPKLDDPTPEVAS